MKQVWLVNHYAVPPDDFGGTRHFELARALLDYDWRVTIIAAGTDHFTRRDRLMEGESWRLDEHDAVPFLWLRTPKYSDNGSARIRNMLTFAVRVLGLAIRRPSSLPRPDVIIGSTVHPTAAFAGWVLSVRFRVPFIFEIRDLWPETLIMMGALRPGSVQARVMHALEKWMLKRAKAVVALLPGIAGYVESRGINPNKVVWIPNGVALPDGAVDRPDAADTRATADQTFTFMYFGAFGNANDLWTMVDAYREFEKLVGEGGALLRMIGEGPLKAQLQAYAETTGGNTISFEPSLPKSEIPALARQADAFLLTVRNLPELYRYGISMNKMFDYMSAGKPTVMANCALNDPIRESGGGISVPAGNASAIAEAMMQIFRLPVGERTEMGRKAQEYVKRNHSFVVLGERMARLLDSCVPKTEKSKVDQNKSAMRP